MHIMADQGILFTSTPLRYNQMLFEKLNGVLVCLVSISIDTNKGGDVVISRCIHDLCRKMLDFREKAAEYTRRSVFYNFPAEAIEADVVSFVTVAYYLGRLALILDQHSVLYIPKKEITVVDNQNILSLWDKTKAFFEERLMDPKSAAYLELSKTIDKILSLIAKENLPIFMSCMRKGRGSFERIPSPQDIVVSCAEEINILLKKAEVKPSLVMRILQFMN